MNLNLLNHFYVVANTLSFSKAAKQLSVSQPAISSSIKKLEEEAGQSLLERTNRGVILTHAGEIVQEQCHSIFKSVEDLKSKLKLESDSISGRVRIGTSDEICSYLLSKKIDIVREEFPELSLEVYTAHPNDLLAKLKDGELDLLLLFYTPPIPEGLSERIIEEVRFKAVVNSNFKTDKSVTKNIIGDKHINRAHASRFESYKTLLKRNKKMKLFLSTNNVNMQLQSVVAGTGIAFLPAFMADPLIKSGKLSDLTPRIKDLYSLKVVMRNSFIPAKGHKRLINLLSK